MDKADRDKLTAHSAKRAAEKKLTEIAARGLRPDNIKELVRWRAVLADAERRLAGQ